MTPRERLILTLNGEKPDILPWAPLMDNYFMDSQPEEMKRAGYVALAKEVGCDLMYRHAQVLTHRYTGDVTKECYFLDPSHEKTIFRTPDGTVSQTIEYHSGTSRVTEYYMKSEEDIPAMMYILDHLEFEPCYEQYQAFSDEIGDAGIATADAPGSPLQKLHEEWMGLEDTIYAIADYPEEMEELMAAMQKKHLEECEVAAQSPAPAIFSYEDTSTTTISRVLYEKYCLEQLSAYRDAVKRVTDDKPYIVHMCGKLTGFRDLVKNTRCDGIDSLCPPCSGDVELWDGRKYWEDKILIGGLDPSATAMATTEELDTRVRNLLEKIDGMDGLILCSGDAVAWGTPMENLKLITKLVGR